MIKNKVKKEKKQVVEERPVQITPIKTERMDLEIEGEQIIVNRFTEDAKNSIEAKQQKTGIAARQQEARNPEKECLDKCYRMSDGKYGYPTIAFKKCFVNAASFLGPNFTKVQLRGYIRILGDMVELKFKNRKHPMFKMIGPEKNVIMREDRVVIKRQTTTIAYRPMFEGWSCILPIIYNASLITAEQIIQIFEYAGFHVGVGDWRSQKDGQFGTFRVKRSR